MIYTYVCICDLIYHNSYLISEQTPRTESDQRLIRIQRDDWPQRFSGKFFRKTSAATWRDLSSRRESCN